MDKLEAVKLISERNTVLENIKVLEAQIEKLKSEGSK